jgi:UDPglucose 6-dehydrogenase
VRIAVAGLWHLGSVTAACCAQHHQVTGLDFAPAVVDGLRAGHAPVSEPGLDELIGDGLRKGTLAFTTDPRVACETAEVLWVCYDTPVDENDEADVESVMQSIRRCVGHLVPGTLVILSSQMPAGTCQRLEREHEALHLEFACLPENLRLGQALAVFQTPDRVVAGVRSQRAHEIIESLLRPFAQKLVFMRPESAEMTKHALNGFLALSVAYINEIARLCEVVGADAREVESGLKSESRIGPRAYLSPGTAFSGGTLARDVAMLSRMGGTRDVGLHLIPAIKASNDGHRDWEYQQLRRLLEGRPQATIAVLGLTYKPKTNTLRRSRALELVARFRKQGWTVKVYDPTVTALPGQDPGVVVCRSAAEAAAGADALVVCTNWDEFRGLDWLALCRSMPRAIILDGNRFLEAVLAGMSGIQYVSVGRTLCH